MESLIKTGTSGKRLQTAARRVLTLLLVFVVAATYVPLDRSFAADRIAKKKTGAAEAKRPAGTAKKTGVQYRKRTGACRTQESHGRHAQESRGRCGKFG